VSNWFGRGLCAVVTCGAPGRDAGVVHLRAQERHCTFMAGFAGQSRLNMGGSFTDGLGTVMARGTSGGNAKVVEPSWLPGRCSVACLAGGRRRNMRRRLACCAHTVMARRTVACDASMAELGWFPRGWRMTCFATRESRHVRRRLAGGG
jgi:hypothetical protein